MTKEERRELGRLLMQEEEQGISEKVQALGSAVLAEVFRLEQAGECGEAKAFEAFLPLDEDFLASLAPLIGQEEFDRTINLYREEKRRARLHYLGGAG